MVKNFRFKLILIFLVIGIVTITLIGLFSIYELKQIQNELLMVSAEYEQLIEPKMQKTGYAILGTIGIYTIAVSIIGAIAIRITIAPIAKILKSAENLLFSALFLCFMI